MEFNETLKAQVAESIYMHEETRNAISRTHPRMEFLPEWLDGDGLPTRVGAWIEAILQPGEMRVGARWVGNHAYEFTLKAREAEDPSSIDDRGGRPPLGWRAQFELVNRHRMSACATEIELYDGANNTIKRWGLYRGQNGPLWKLIMEVQPQRHHDYQHCPASVDLLKSELDAMVFEMTRVRLRLSQYLATMTDAFTDNHGDVPTTELHEEVYRHVVARYRDFPNPGHEERRDLYRQLRAEVMQILGQ